MTMRKLSILLSVWVFLLSACSRTSYWVKPGGSQPEFYATQAQCHNQAYFLPQTPKIVSNPSYLVTTTTLNGTAYSTVQPYKSPYQSMADALSSASADFADIARRENFIENCMISNGWTKVEESALSVTVKAYAVRKPDNVNYSGSVTGHIDRTGTIRVVGDHNEICVGTFRYTSVRGGDGIIRCDDGKSANISFVSVSNTSGYGVGTSDQGDRVLFVYGMDREEGRQYLTAN